MVRSQREQILGMSSLHFGLLLVAAGVVAYGIMASLKHAGVLRAPESSEAT